MIRKEFWIKSEGNRLYCVFEEPENPKNAIIILLHGLTNSHTNCPLISETTCFLQKKGYPTFRFDYFGSGRSDGEFKDKTWGTLVQNTKDVFRYVKSEFKYPNIGIWGRSVGAILGTTICDDPSIFASVFLSMTTHTHISFSASFPKDQMFSLPIKGTAIVKGEPILSKRFYMETIWIDQLQKRHLLKAKNMLIIQGTEDKTVYNLSWAKEVLNLVNKPKDLIYINGADHAYHGHEEEVLKKIVVWYERCLHK
jgi:hypothetical protein